MAHPRQMSFFDGQHPMNANISIKENHELVELCHLIDWPECIELAMDIRAMRIKSHAGREPHYRELLGAVVLMSVRNITFRQAEDLIAHYAPARYLCNLMDSNWNPDHITIFEFTQGLGSEGMELLNQKFLGKAQGMGLLDSKKLMSDTTAQEAMIPYPNEVGLMNRFSQLVSKGLKKVAGKFTEIKSKVKESVKKIKSLARNSHLFAKTQEAKRKVGKKLYHTTLEIQDLLKLCLSKGKEVRSKPAKELQRLSSVMDVLLPQILYFIETGFVASKKIIHLQMNELYSIVRGKAGKSVEFGLKWGINRIDGFVMGFLINNGINISDKKFCLQAVKEHISCFSKSPETYGFDRGGYSKSNIEKLRKLGVKNVGVAPAGNANWEVSEKLAESIRRERAQVEGVIGVLKSSKYKFNKPYARSVRSMETYAQRSFLGFNLSKAVRMLQLQAQQTAL